MSGMKVPIGASQNESYLFSVTAEGRKLTEDGLQDAFWFCLCASLLQSCSTLWPPWLLCPWNSRWEFWSELPLTYSRGPRDRTGSLALQAGMQSLPSEQSGKACPLGWKSAKFWRPEPRGRFWDLHAMSFVFLKCDDMTRQLRMEKSQVVLPVWVSLFCLWFPG